MPCVHLKELFRLCDENHLKISSSELVHVVCQQCQKQEVCPSNLVDLTQLDADDEATSESPAAPNSQA